jgi:3-hydroxyisobutyrate dehydrogenase
MLRSTAAPLDPDDGLRPIFTHTRGLGEKDLALAVGLGESLGVETPIARLAHDHLGAALGVPHPEEHP